jgi:hypothetical protein
MLNGWTRSRVGQIEPALDPLNSEIHAVQPVRHIGILVLEISETLLDPTNIVNRTMNMAKMFKDDVVGLDH